MPFIPFWNQHSALTCFEMCDTSMVLQSPNLNGRELESGRHSVDETWVDGHDNGRRCFTHAVIGWSHFWNFAKHSPEPLRLWQRRNLLVSITLDWVIRERCGFQCLVRLCWAFTTFPYLECCHPWRHSCHARDDSGVEFGGYSAITLSRATKLEPLTLRCLWV